MSNDNTERVSIDQSRIQQAREIQAQIRSSSRSNQIQNLNTQQPSVSRYEYNGNGLSTQPGTFLQEGVEEDGEPL